MIIIKETKKAKLIKINNKEFWIQNRWLREDGTLTPAGQKAFEEAKTSEEKEAEAKARQEAKNRLVEIADIVWESEKAIGLDIVIDVIHAEVEKKERLFFPKSMIKNNSIPAWLISEKINEKIKEVSRRYNTMALDVIKTPFINY